MKMKDIYEEGRPCEKCIAYGAETLSDAELLAVVLRTGSEGETVCGLAERILSMPGYEGLRGLSRIPISRLMKIKGVGKVKAAQIRCIAELSQRMAKTEAAERLCFEAPATVADYFMEDLRYEEQENLIVLFLNSKNKLIREKLMFKGTVNASIISPREIFLEALEAHAVSIVLVHNHPSGDPAPSPEDIKVTCKVKKAGDLIDIRLLDHVIIGDRRYTSMMEQGLIKP